MTTESTVLPLSALDRSSLPIAGGKAANLGEMIRAGVPVPPGFVLTTSAFRAAAEAANIGPKLEALAGTEPNDRARLAALAGEIRAELSSVTVPDAIAEACVRAYDVELGGVAVAVRSSATAEDLPDASFAGQQDTYLGVLGKEALLDAVRRCWASLFTERAVVYRADRSIDPRDVSLAVVVQRLVHARAAGVLFTANPVTGRRREAVIDAAPGLGEAVVSGATNPDHLEVRVDTGEIVTRRLGDKRVVIEALPGGGTRHEERADGSAEACISDAEARALAAMGARVEAHYGAPQDIEWAIDPEGKLLLVQSRPITTLFPIPAGPLSKNDDLRVFFSFNVAQGVFRPFSPMGLQFWRAFGGVASRGLGLWDGEPLDGPPIFAVGASRLFLDITAILRDPLGRRVAAFALSRMEARSGVAVRAVLDDERLGVVETPRWKIARAALRALARTRAPVTLARALRDPDAVPDRIAAKVDAAIAVGEVPEGAPPSAYVDAVERMIREGVGPFIFTAIPSIAGALVSMLLFRRALSGLMTEDEVHTLLRSLPNNPTTEMDLELWSLSRRVGADPASRSALGEEAPAALAKRYAERSLPAVLQRELGAFLARWGARGVAEIDIGVPRWRDDPTHILGSLANYLSLGDDASPPDVAFERGAREAERKAEELVERAREKGVLRGGVARFAVPRVRRLLGAREAPKFGIVRIIAHARSLLLQAGRLLVQEGKLAAEDDVFLLDLRELRAVTGGTDLRALVTERRRMITQELGRKHVPRILLSDGTEPEMMAAAASGEGGLSGTPASAGRVTGKARVVLDPVGAKIEPGEILVAPSTDPGWTPLFLTAGGLVMEMGGSMSHGAVVAREYGIPAVVGVAGATARITTGQQITVDGGAGRVGVEV
ncbi:PEP/pyruvate-binding domain-containing protein [Polyangium mundeleinium]|uniref:PEP/pyruvate-binding domain-containing protein n=1 Tax=Polyangium mundeleinium TaxID=2995306 RepID=A0ABT5EJ77_9BACT|nr:PEP/pyruvate-binding domain-containing protein [Polyangium mundeleinium]MDC0741885.1 PEP/pyruvate-binding domain-containing protein [Polyangium mundeleinium]